MADDGTMTDRRCVHCGHPTPEGTRFCAECGAAVRAAVTTRTAAMRPGLPPQPGTQGLPNGSGHLAAALRQPAAKTIAGFAAAPNPLDTTQRSPSGLTAEPPKPPPFAPPAPPPIPPPPVPAGRHHALQRTMIGITPTPMGPFPSPVASGGPTGAEPSPGRAGAAPPGDTPPNADSPLKRTMLGVAMPGIAPTEPTEPPNWAVATGPVATPRYPSFEPPPPAPPRPLVPAPPPLADLPAPASLRRRPVQGIPLATVALAAGALLLAGGGAIAWFWHAPPTITAQAKSSPSGEDILVLHCDPSRCHDGTQVDVAGARGTFAGGESELTLPRPLHVGSNELALRLTRGGWSRDQTMKLIVPVAFRIRADPSTMSASPPSVTIRVEAAPGSQVTMDGKPVALDAAGTGVYAVDESAATEGTADESKTVSVDVAYAVTPPGGAPATSVEKGSVTARVVVAPLHVDAPGPHAVVEADHVLVAGRVAKGATASVDGAPVNVGPEGIFTTNVSLPTLGDRSVTVRTETSVLRPRTVHLSIKRVASLKDEAKAFEQREATVGYDDAVKDLAGNAGRPIIVEGEVIDSRRFGYGAVLIVDDRRGCAKGPCVARVVVDEDSNFTRGAFVRAYGHVAPFAAPSGQAVPEVDADFVVAGRR